MKTSFLFLLTIIFAIILISSCQKEVSRENGFIQNQANTSSLTGDSNYLYKIYDLSDNGAGLDTDYILTFKYDAQKRVTALHDSEVTPAGLVHFESTYFFYNSNDSLPFKSVVVSTEAAPYLDSTTSFFYYNSLGKIKDSVAEADYSSGILSRTDRTVTTFSRNGNMLYSNSSGHQVYNNLTQYSDHTEMDTSVLDSRGNITGITGVASVISPYPNASTMDQLSSASAFDNHPNPFAKLSFFKALAYGNFNAGQTLFVSPNNITYYQSGIPPYVSNTNFTNQYNAAGFPVKITAVTGPDTEIQLLTYRAL